MGPTQAHRPEFEFELLSTSELVATVTRTYDITLPVPTLTRTSQTAQALPAASHVTSCLCDFVCFCVRLCDAV